MRSFFRSDLQKETELRWMDREGRLMLVLSDEFPPDAPHHRPMISETMHQTMTGLIRRNHQQAQEELAEQLLALARPGINLVPAVEGLCAHQLHAGVVQDDLHVLERYQLRSRSDPSRVFYVDYNPARSRRHQGAGRTQAPPGWERVHGDCHLCAPNILWQQRFCQFPLPLALPSGRYWAWANPFPLGHFHVTIAADQHTPQTWMTADRDEAFANLMRRLTDLVPLAEQLPDYLVFENGTGAGATVTGHHHFQALRKWPGLARLPIEEAARRQEHAQDSARGSCVPFVLLDYPVAALCCSGSVQTITSQMATMVCPQLSGSDELNHWKHLTTNLIACRESGVGGRLRLFLIPRNAHITRATGITSAVASLELAGEIVFSQEQERDRISAGQVTYDHVWDTLASVQDESSRRLLRECNLC